MSYDPIGRVLKVTQIGSSQKIKLNHVPNTVINPLQLTGQKMKTIIEQNPQGSIPVPQKVRSVTIDVVGKPKTIFKEDNIDLSRAKRSVERHLSKPLGYSERILSRSKNQRDSSQTKNLQSTYSHPDVWNQSINTESKRKQFNFTKEQTLMSLKTMNKAQRDEFILRSHNQAKSIEGFYSSLRKKLIKREFVRQYGEDIDYDVEDSELLNKLFNSYTRLRNISINQRTDQKFIYLEELKDFCFTIGFDSDQKGEDMIETFYHQIYNPELLQDAKIISHKPSLHSLRTMTIIEQLIPGQALARKVDMISMRAVVYNYKKYLQEHFDVHDKFSRNAAKQLLVDLLSNINPWIQKKQLLKLTLQKSEELEEEFFTIDNLCGNGQILKQINKKIKERNEQIQEKLILSKFIHSMVRNAFLNIDSLKDNFVKQIVQKAEKISYLEDFMAGLLTYLHLNEPLSNNNNNNNDEVESQDMNSDRLSDQQQNENGQYDSQAGNNKQLLLEKIAEFIHSNNYRGEQHDIIINFLVRIRKQVSERTQNQQTEFIMSDDVAVFCTKYKARQDFKQQVIQAYIEKAKQFYDKHMGEVQINDENRKKFDSNTIGTYTLKKMQKYDTIIGNRVSKVNQILNLVQIRTIFGVDSRHFDVPQTENEFFQQIEDIFNNEQSQQFKLASLFSDDFVHAYIQDYLEIQEKEKNKARAWDAEIKQALQLYQRESQRLLNVVQSWNPKEKLKRQKVQASPNSSNSKQKSSRINSQRVHTEVLSDTRNNQKQEEMNRQFLQNFIEEEEKQMKQSNSKLDSQRSSRGLGSNRDSQNQLLKNQAQIKTDSGTRTKKQNPIQQQIQNNITNSIQKISTNQASGISSQNKKKEQVSAALVGQTQQNNSIKQTGNNQTNQQIKNSLRNSNEQMNIKTKTMNTQENENLSFFEYIDNQQGYQDDKNSSFQSKNSQQNNIFVHKKVNVPPLPISTKLHDISQINEPSPAQSSHNDLSTLNKTNLESVANDHQIQKANQMYTDLYNILNRSSIYNKLKISIKDEFDIV